MTNKINTKKDPSVNDLAEPLVVPQDEHGISNDDLDRDALNILRRLKEAGHFACLVGGGVRDILLGKAPKDFDISTDARPGEIRKIFRNSRIIGRRFRLVQVFFHGNKIIEVSTFRQRSEFDINGKDRVLASNNSFGGPAEDAFRRDLTINALFYEIEESTIIDYVGGLADLKNGIVRIVGEPDIRITRDPARIMRVIRHAARTGFEIEKATWDSVKNNMDKLSVCPTSRIRDEFFKDLKGGACAKWISLAVDSGLFVTLVPFYTDMFKLKNDVEKKELIERLTNIFSVIDRLNNGGAPVPEQLIFALLLTPWAEETLSLMEATTLKDAYDVSRNARTLLAPTFTNLNIKRGMQDSIARCLATLPILINHDRDNKGKGWPKWLRKKSYFNDGLQIFKIVREANGGTQVSLATTRPSGEAVTPVNPVDSGAETSPINSAVLESPLKQDSRQRKYQDNRGPASAKDIPGGIFGFRRW